MQHLGAVTDDAAALFIDSGQEAGNIDQADDRDVEHVAGTREAGHLVGSVTVERPGKDHRLVGDDADNHAGNAGKADDHVAREIGVQFEHFTVVDQTADDCMHVDRQRRPFGDQLVHAVIQFVANRHLQLVGRVFGVV